MGAALTAMKRLTATTKCVEFGQDEAARASCRSDACNVAVHDLCDVCACSLDVKHFCQECQLCYECNVMHFYNFSTRINSIVSTRLTFGLFGLNRGFLNNV